MNEPGWQPLRRSKQVRRAVGAEGFVITPFMRLARVHAAAAASDASIAVALAGSIFFSISPQESRWRVALYLLVTMAPFAVVTPLIGPAIDRLRGGRRVMIVVTVIGRVVLAFMISRHFDSLLLFPEAFGLLVMQKGYAVAKSALVPQLSSSEQDLVTLNSRLSLISAFAGITGATISGLASLISGAGRSGCGCNLRIPGRHGSRVKVAANRRGCRPTGRPGASRVARPSRDPRRVGHGHAQGNRRFRNVSSGV